MGRYFVLLAVVALFLCAVATLAACGSGDSQGETAEPATTTPPLIATEGAPSNESLTSSAPEIEQDDDDGVDFAFVNSFSSAGKNDGIAPGNQEPTLKSGSDGPAEGSPYSWVDGDRTLTVFLQTDLVVEKDSDGTLGGIVETNGGGADPARGEGGQSGGDALPVFRSESGELMTLPGGVLLVLNAEWTETETDAFFSDNGVKMNQVSELTYAANGFFIETEPGFPSLNLANELAVLDGVELSSPNWGTEAIPK